MDHRRYGMLLVGLNPRQVLQQLRAVCRGDGSRSSQTGWDKMGQDGMGQDGMGQDNLRSFKAGLGQLRRERSHPKVVVSKRKT